MNIEVFKTKGYQNVNLIRFGITYGQAIYYSTTFSKVTADIFIITNILNDIGS